MIKPTFKTPANDYRAVCEKMRYVRGSGYFMESIREGSDSDMRSE